MNDPSDAKRRVRLILRAQAGDQTAYDELLRSVQVGLFEGVFLACVLALGAYGN